MLRIFNLALLWTSFFLCLGEAQASPLSPLVGIVGSIVNSIAESASTPAPPQPLQTLPRSFPPTASLCYLGAHGLPAESWVTSNNARLNLSPALVIRDQFNRFVVSNLLPQDVPAMCGASLDPNSIDHIWILTNTEYQLYLSTKKN